MGVGGWEHTCTMSTAVRLGLNAQIAGGWGHVAPEIFQCSERPSWTSERLSDLHVADRVRTVSVCHYNDYYLANCCSKVEELFLQYLQPHIINCSDAFPYYFNKPMLVIIVAIMLVVMVSCTL